jgi:hypothetical protein
MFDMIALSLGAVANVVLWRALVKSMDEHQKPKRPKKPYFRKGAEPRTPNHFPTQARASYPAELRAPGLASRLHDPR